MQTDVQIKPSLRINLAPQKTCTKCGVLKFVSEFHRMKDAVDGFRPNCKACRVAVARAHYERNIVKIKARAKAHYAADPDKFQARSKKRYATDPKHRAAVKRRAVEYNRTKGRARRKANPKWALADRLRESLSHALARRAYKKRGKTFDLLGYTPDALRDHLLPFVGKPCVRCGDVTVALSNSHIDHIIPIRTANSCEEVLGLNKLANLRMICAHCNFTKQGKIESD